MTLGNSQGFWSSVQKQNQDQIYIFLTVNHNVTRPHSPMGGFQPMVEQYRDVKAALFLEDSSIQPSSSLSLLLRGWPFGLRPLQGSTCSLLTLYSTDVSPKELSQCLLLRSTSMHCLIQSSQFVWAIYNCKNLNLRDVELLTQITLPINGKFQTHLCLLPWCVDFLYPLPRMPYHTHCCFMYCFACWQVLC